jgi:hypothetical protein|tara:strand:- start:1081 stop:1308 length:228 start_codon:yes stop_codon:yes gene_type:complete
MFGKDKNAILTTTLIVKVRKYKNQQPYFSLYNTPSMANEENARDVVKKLNEVEKYNTQDIKEGWQTEYYAVNMTL